MLGGQGSRVVEFDLVQGDYSMAWRMQRHDSFIVNLQGTSRSSLVDLVPPNQASGETFVRLAGGHYALDVQAPTLTWSITFTRLA